MGDTQTLIQLSHMSVERGGRMVLSDVSLSIRRGEITTLIGPNGAGKSSLLKAALGLIPYQSGDIERRAGLSVGYVPQKFHLETSLPLSVLSFLALIGTASQTAIATALQQVGVAHLLKASMHGLSGGETQRVLLARAILKKPDLLLLDEPAQGVDAGGQRLLYKLIESIRHDLGCAVLMVSHDLHLVMAASDQVICINGHVCCQGQPEHVSEHPEYLKLFGDDTSELAVYVHHHDHDHCDHRPDDTHEQGKEKS